MMTSKEMAEATFAGMKSLLAAALNPLADKVKAIAERLDTLHTPKDGERGPAGEPGPKGEDGPPGPQGDRGNDGAPGVDGSDGKSVHIEEVLREVAPLVTKAVAELELPVGPQGPKGDAGTDGIPGAPGADGKSVDVDAIEREVAARVAKALSEVRDGVDGKRGEKGDPGRDAMQISINSSIDERQSYSRGTWAKHLGGLWRSTKTTEGMDGWECVIEGVAAVTHEKTGEREVTVTTTLSSGAKSLLAYHFHDIIHRGTYDHSKTYDQGDQVAWAGSTWVALIDGVQEPPNSANTDKWVLGSKKGSEGASAYQSAKKAGFNGSEYDWVKSLKGERGADGRSVR